MSDQNSPPNSFPFCYPPGYFFQNFYDSYPYRNSTTSMPHGTTSSSPPGQRSSSPQSGSSASGTSTPTCEIASTSTEGNTKQDKRQGKTTQDRWTEDQVKYLVDLWEANISRLESQQSRKVWGEIATKINKQFDLARLPSQCERKIKHLKKKYKEAKDWNRSQTGGNNETCEHFDVFDRVLGGRDVVTLKHVQETANAAAKNKEKLPDSPAGDEEEGYTSDQAEEALQTMGIKVKSRSERKKGKGKGKGRKRSLENDDSEDFARFTERVEHRGDRLANAVEQMQEMQREQTQAMTGFLAALTKAIEKN